jgi:hypothetical protein
VDNWRPDFRISFPCPHSECDGSHTLLVSIVAANDLQSMSGHPALTHAYGVRLVGADEKQIIADAGALFGSHPGATAWTMSHGAGGGSDNVPNWVVDATRCWERAGQLVRS